MKVKRRCAYMEWSSLFSKQANLDHYIMENHKLHNQDLFNEKKLALLVELGELANETRCIKLWREKEASPASAIVEEYVDTIHLLLSIGLEKDYRFFYIEVLI